MKKLIALLLCFVCLFGYACGESPATPTDLEEFIELEEDDWGQIDIVFERKVYITIDKKPEYIGDTLVLVATLVDFKPDDEYTIYWQYSTDSSEWINLADEHTQKLIVVTNNDNYANWWRVFVKVEGHK